LTPESSTGFRLQRILDLTGKAGKDELLQELPCTVSSRV